jgi:hypothetical protein
MPIPFLLGAVAILAGGVGVAKGVDAKEMMDRARRIGREGERIVDNANEGREEAKVSANNTIEKLGNTKLNILSTNINTFVNVFSTLKNVDFQDSVGLDELRDFTPKSKSIGQLKKASLNATDLGNGLVTGVTSGGIVAVGAYGAIGLLGAASTGTAISSLTGVAATNATLAWFGGGSLAAGGLGIAGGTAILGGLIAGPALLVGSIFLHSKADEALSEAKTYRARAKQFAAECNNTCSLLAAIETRAEQIIEILQRLDNQLDGGIVTMQQIIKQKGTNWKNYTVQEKKCIGSVAMVAKTLKVIMDTPLLNEDGSLNEASGKILESSKI